MKYFVISNLVLIWALAISTPAAETKPDITIRGNFDPMGFLQPVPVSISGFTGEADSVLRNDLTFMGFKFVGPTEARFLITGNNAGRLEGRVINQATKAQELGRTYSNGTLRQQVHAFADEVATLLTGLPGIAQTKIVYKAEAGLGRSEAYVADFDGFGPVAATRDGSILSNPCWLGKSAIVYSSYKL